LYGFIMPRLCVLHSNWFIASLGIPFALGPVALMVGNYSQHIFVNPDDPTSNFGLACNHLAAPFNMLTFNDGYHLTHHLTSRCHWSEMPLHFIKNLDKYEAEGALCFHTINFDEISGLVLSGKLKRLAKYVVQLTPKHLDEEELITLFRKRLRPIRSPNFKLDKSQKAAFLLNQAGWVMAMALGFPNAGFVVCLIPAFSFTGWMLEA